MESQILSAIRTELGKLPFCVVWRVSAGFDPVANQRYGLAPGCSDLLGLVQGGRMLALEVKTSSGRLRADQKVFLELVGSMGGFADVVRSVDAAVIAATLAVQGEPSPYRRDRES